MSDITDRENTRLTSELKTALKLASEAKLAAAKSEESAAKLDLAKVEVEKQLEDTRKLVADSNLRAAKAELARAELEKQIADTKIIAQGAAKTATANEIKIRGREISPQQRSNILSGLKGVGKARAVVEFSSGDIEASKYASDIISVLREAEFDVQIDSAVLMLDGSSPSGLSIRVDTAKPPPGALALQKSLRRAGVESDWYDHGLPDVFLLRIGVKP